MAVPGPRCLAEEVSYGDITVESGPLFPGETLHGYHEYRFTITNSSKDKTHRIELALPSEARQETNGDQLWEVTRTVDVGPSSSVRVPLWQPLSYPLVGRGVRVTIDGQEQKSSLGMPLAAGGGASRGMVSGAYYGGGRLYEPPSFLLVSPGISGVLETQLRGIAEAAMTLPATPGAGSMMGSLPPTTGGRGPRWGPRLPAAPPGLSTSATRFLANVQVTRAMTPVNDWEPNWLPYAGFDAILITADELNQAPQPVRNALEEFVEAGGSLTVTGRPNLPATWKERHVQHGNIALFYPGFGNCLELPAGDTAAWPTQAWEHVAATWQTAASLWRRRSATEDEANHKFPVVDRTAVPVRGLFVLMVCFCLLIGPVNLLLLGRWKRRIWMLWTVPVISLTTCAAVFGYMILAEGWTGHRRVRGLTLLDETQRRAVTMGCAAFYTPLSRSDGLRFSLDTELTPMFSNVFSEFGRGGNAHTVDWTSDQHLASGWLPPRVPVHLWLRKCETRRERITVKRASDDKLTLLNGLGADIRDLWYAAEDGTVYTAVSVPAGGQALLNRVSLKLPKAPEPDCMLRLFERTDDFITLAISPEDAKACLLPRHYIARLVGAPFIEEGLRNAKSEPCESIVYGILRGEGDAD